MKVEVKENKKQEEKPFPKLMVNKVNQIVLFHSKSEGTLVCDKDDMSSSNFGYHTGWIGLVDFEDFNGSITLSND